MLDAPKGYKHWEIDKEGNPVISSNAPDWAKEEFDRYQEQLKDSEKSDEQGNIKSI